MRISDWSSDVYSSDLADLRRLASAEIEQVLEQGGDGIVLIEAGTSIATHLAEDRLGAVGEQRVDGRHVVAHEAVTDRDRAAGVVRRHAAGKIGRAHV